MLPIPKHQPASLCECLVVPLVALHIAAQLGRPVAIPIARHPPMLRAAVPKAAIDKDGDLLAGENGVGLASQALQWLGMLAESKP